MGVYVLQRKKGIIAPAGRYFIVNFRYEFRVRSLKRTFYNRVIARSEATKQSIEQQGIKIASLSLAMANICSAFLRYYTFNRLKLCVLCASALARLRRGSILIRVN